MKPVFCALLLGAAPAALAEGFPAAFQVTDVAANDVLNIRAEPAADAAKLGEIGPYAINVEVLRLSDDGKWGLVGLPEGNGWVAMRYLAPVAEGDPNLLPRPLSCFGTEPFWGLGLYPRGAEWTTPEGRADVTVTEEAVAPGGYHLRAEEGPTRVYHLNVSRQMCGDGMSDREFGFSASLFIESPDGNAMLSGCCTRDHRN